MTIVNAVDCRDKDSFYNKISEYINANGTDVKISTDDKGLYSFIKDAYPTTDIKYHSSLIAMVMACSNYDYFVISQFDNANSYTYKDLVNSHEVKVICESNK